MNNKQATIKGLETLGYIEEVGRSRKYRCFRECKPDGVPVRTWLVGKSGALRVIDADRSAISESRSSTNSRAHRGLRFIGRWANSLSDKGLEQLTHRQAQAMFHKVCVGLIVCDNDGNVVSTVEGSDA